MSPRFQKSFQNEPRLNEQVFNLMQIVFPELGIPEIAPQARNAGAAWETASTPFIFFQENQVVSHIGVLEIPLCLMGENVTVAGIHGVATHPEYRRRGYYRQLMQEVLEYCSNRYQTLILTTENPEFYQPFGFRIVQEHIFIAKNTPSQNNNEFRRLFPLQNNNELDLLLRLVDNREPVSNILGVWPERALFYFNEINQPLYYSQELDILISGEIVGKQLKLFDIVAQKMCELKEILRRLPEPVEEVIIHFSPDRLDASVQPVPHILDGNSYLMVRGCFPPEGERFMLPRSARC